MARWSDRSSVLVVLFSIAMVVGCGAAPTVPVATTNLWQAEDVRARAPMTSIVVFGRGATESWRRLMEDAFVASLAERGVSAKASYTIFPTMPDDDAARDAVRTAGFDGALVATLRSITERSARVPRDYTSPGTPGRVISDLVVDLETKVWDLRGTASAPMVWSARTRTEGSSTEDALEMLTRELTPQLASAGVVAKRS